MKRWGSVIAAGYFALILPAGGQQISVGARTATDMFLLYEAIPVEVGLRNNTGATLELKPAGDRPWLRFVIADGHGRAVETLATTAVESVLIGARQTVSRTVDVLPLYDLREPGAYTIQAVVEGDGLRAVSAPVKISIFQGHDLWSETVGLPAAAGGKDQFRTYSLVNKHGRERDTLYAGVSDEQGGRVFGLLPLGRYIALGEPQAKVDKAGELHALWRMSPRQLGYVKINSLAEVLDRAIYTDLASVPRLVQDPDGTVRVRGGEKTHPKSDRMLTTEELQAPVVEPAPPPPPKKRWWQFWKRAPKPPPANPSGIPAPGSLLRRPSF